jgi:hypothetical protein
MLMPFLKKKKTNQKTNKQKKNILEGDSRERGQTHKHSLWDED